MIKEAIKTIRAKGDFVHKLHIGGKTYYQISNCSVPITINKSDLNVYRNLSSEFGFAYFRNGIWAQNYTEREVINMAKDQVNGRPWNKTIKKERKRKNRSRTKVLINSENFEAFGPKSLAKDSNQWYYD